MGYFTYRIFKDISLERLQQKVKANLALYEPGGAASKISVTLVEGHGCSAILMGYLHHEDAILAPIGYQFDCVWMDVRHQDGDWWDLSIYRGTEHECTHSVNPWAHDDHFVYDQGHVDYRIEKVCKLWSSTAAKLERYLLLWREPVTRFGEVHLVARNGKAYEDDEYGYGDADQIHDFVRAFGIGRTARSVTIAGFP